MLPNYDAIYNIPNIFYTSTMQFALFLMLPDYDAVYIIRRMQRNYVAIYIIPNMAEMHT